MSHPLTTASRPSLARRNHPMAWAVAVALGTVVAPPSQAQQAFSPGWFADRGAAQSAAAQSGRMPNGVPIQFQLPAQQQDAARQKLQQSIDNLGTAAQAIALQQRLQEQARQARREAGFIVADGLGKDGLKVDENPLTRGWLNAREASQSQGGDGRIQVSIEQTADKAILNWETFNIGGNTTLTFQQNPDWAVLNRVNDPSARPSQFLGQLKANGTVFVANRNGVVFGNNSQVNVRNLVAAAARISDGQFRDNGLFSADSNTAALTEAFGAVMVEQGARIITHEPGSATRGGGYVLLAGSSVENAGQIETRKGQAQLAAGDSFVIRRGVGTAQNTASTTAGNEVAPRFVQGSGAGEVRNSGLIQAREGDITLAGRKVEQAGVAIATTTLSQRGTIHLLNALSDRQGQVTLESGATTAVLIEDDGKSAVLDSQREALIKASAEQDLLRAASSAGTFDNLSRLQDRRDQSRVEIVSGGDINFKDGSLTVATGGQVVSDAARRSYVGNAAWVDVSGAVGVRVAMESNNVQVKVQGNELRDSPDNRDSGTLISSEVWIDRRELQRVAAGTGGHAAERWYAGGGLLEVGGYLDNQRHSIGEWAAQGGTVQLSGTEVVTHGGSRINLAGGSLDVQSGVIKQSWLRGTDGRLYRLDDAPAEQQYAGLYKGFEVDHQRWGVNEAFRNPLVAPGERVDNGYTVGRDAGRLVISAPTAVLQGDINTQVFQGAQQAKAPDLGKDGYAQAQTAVARNAQLWLGRYDSAGRNAVFDTQVRIGEGALPAADWTLQAPVSAQQRNTVWLDAARLSEQQWGRIDLATAGSIALDGTLRLQDGGQLVLTGSDVRLGGDIAIAGGQLQAGNLLAVAGNPVVPLLQAGRGRVEITDGARIDLAGRWSNLLLDPGAAQGQAWSDGGRLQLENSHDVVVGRGSELIVDAGGRVDGAGKARIGKGGSVSLQANSLDTGRGDTGRLSLAEDARISALGQGSGSLSLTDGGNIRIGGDGQVDDVLTLRGALFGSGFSKYDINAHKGLEVADDAQVEVVMPGLRLASDAVKAVTREEAVQAWLAPLYSADPLSGRISQRAGAGLLLRSQFGSRGGDLRIGTGASVQVDPVQSIELRGGGNLTVEGRLYAAGGRIRLDDVRTALDLFDGQPNRRTFRIADGAELDVSGDAFSAEDAVGRLRGLTRKGGSIEIGGALDWEGAGEVSDRPLDAFIVIERGARLRADGSSAALHIDGQGTQQVDSEGGQIVLRSANALYLHGDMQAAAGGAGARGGTLGIAFGGGIYAKGSSTDVQTPRVLALSQQRVAAPAATVPTYGDAQLSVEQIRDGGFDNLSLFAAVRSEGDIDLRMGQSLRLSGSIGLLPGAAPASTIAVHAPYMKLANPLWSAISGNDLETSAGAPLATGLQHRLRADAQLIDIRDRVALDGFDDVALHSSGDVRFLTGASSTGALDADLLAANRLEITAAQLYPVTGATARIGVGFATGTLSRGMIWTDPTGVLRINGLGGATPAAPLSAMGSLMLAAATVEQGGVVRAPMGSIALGGTDRNNQIASTVSFLPGSLTSTSGTGLSLPYGGTVDGIQWRRDGAAVAPRNVGGGALPVGIGVISSQTDVARGAVLDMNGGGELTGAAFVSGRGGSVDILRHTLAEANPRYGFSQAGSEVYAILPGYTGNAAPQGLSDGTVDPAVGQQIVVPAGVPGLAAGTYTLLPASFALQSGAFRVEVGASSTTGSATPLPTGTGSWRVAGHRSEGLVEAVSPLLTDLLLTPAANVRRHSGYNETSYNAFTAASAQRLGLPRGWQTVDAGMLRFELGNGAGRQGTSALRVEGEARFQAAAGGTGTGGSVEVTRVNQVGSLEIIAAGGKADTRLDGSTIEADALNALHPSRLVVNARVRSTAQSVIDVAGVGQDVVLRSGAVLRAPEVLIGAVAGGSGIVVEAGAAIDTLGLGTAGLPSSLGYVYQVGGALLAVSNDRPELLGLAVGTDGSNVNIDIGGCGPGASCAGQARLVSEGSINVTTNGQLQLREGASYGTRELALGVGNINLGSAEAIARAAAVAALPPGMTLNQQVLGDLLRGNTATGAPALDTLRLNASEAINVFGSVDLDTRDAATGKPALRNLVLGTPAIHGYGDNSDHARIFAADLTWAGQLGSASVLGSTQTPPAAPGIAARLGSGQLDIITDTLRLAPSPRSQPLPEVVAGRQVLGFAGVNLQAARELVFAGNGALQVHQRQGDYVAGKGWTLTGGNLDIQSPLITGAAGAKLSVKAGGTLAAHGAGAGAAADALGAELDLRASDIVLDTRFALASGRLVANADHSVRLGSKADLDLSGRKVSLFDVDNYSWGGDVELTAADGSVLADAASRIDVSARNNRAGRLTVTALGASDGRVELAGQILGQASGRHDVSGSLVPYDSGELVLRAQQLQDFSGLNQRLTRDGVTGARSFQIKQGDLLIGDEVKARKVDISVDGGALRVSGRIDASGEEVGSIRLAARDGLQLDGTLDAHGTALRVDSYGSIIDSPNRAIVELESRTGTLALGHTAMIDLRSGTDVAVGTATGQNDGRARGTLVLNMPRSGSADASIRSDAGLQVLGARDIFATGVRRYEDAPLATTPDVNGHRSQMVTQAWLDNVIDPDSAAWMNAALGNGDLSARLAALGSVSLRPGVEIVGMPSAANPNGDLTVSGDLDLSGYRYGPQANRSDPARRGFGEAGALRLRAAGDLHVYGSINDGFAPPPLTPDDAGWQLFEGSDPTVGVTPFGGDIVVPGDGVVLDIGSRFPASSVLNYPIQVQGTKLPAGTTLPVEMTLTQALQLPAGTVLSAAVTLDNGQVQAAGTVLAQALSVPAGARLAAGFQLRSAADVAAHTWPAGVPLPTELRLAASTPLPRGALIPSMALVKLPGGTPVKLRPTDSDGRQGRNWALAQMLPEGTTSWDLSLVAGADTESADPRTRRFGASGDLTLSDTHYGVIRDALKQNKFVRERLVTAAGALRENVDSSWVGKTAKALAEHLGKSEDALCAAGGSCANAPYLFTRLGAEDLAGDPSLEGTPIKDFGDLPWVGMSEEELCNPPEAGYCVMPGEMREVTTMGPPRHGTPLWSVLRTGTGDLQLAAARDVQMRSVFGVYTAGTPTSLGNGHDARFQTARSPLGARDALLGLQQSTGDYDAALAAYQAWYPDYGGNLSVSAGRDVTGATWGSTSASGATSISANTFSGATGGWLWRQGTGTAAGVEPVATSWWINFGTYAAFNTADIQESPRMVGFTGLGTLGGGNLEVEAGRHGGVTAAKGEALGVLGGTRYSTAINAAVGATGRVDDGRLVQTGGGDLRLRFAGALNPLLAATSINLTENDQTPQLNGTLVNLRGHLGIDAARIGGSVVRANDYQTISSGLRAMDPFRASTSAAMGGPLLVLGDAVADLQARGDVVLSSAADGGRVRQYNAFEALADDGSRLQGVTGFSLWTPSTAINLFSAGGDIVPVGQATTQEEADGGREGVVGGALYRIYPSRLKAIAASGDIKLSRSASREVLLTAPGANSTLQLLAGNSILAAADAPMISSSGADARLPSPFDPAFNGFGGSSGNQLLRSNLSQDGTMAPATVGLSGGSPLFAFGPNRPMLGTPRAGGGQPNRFYAGSGDIIGLRTGGEWTLRESPGMTRTVGIWYDVSAPVQLRAGTDILGSAVMALNTGSTDMTVVQAGRDIVHTNVTVFGSGDVDVSAGRQLRQEDSGSIVSRGGLIQGDTRPGASIAVTAGNQHIAFDAVRARYLDPSNLADPAQSLASQPGKAAKIYDKELKQWLQQRFGLAVDGAEALAAFDRLPSEQQRIFLRQVYYAELREGGREYTDQNGPRFGSYLRGRDAIATLLPDKDARGATIDRSGDIVMYGGSGVRTEAGGNIELMAPGGQIVAGVIGEAPPASAGLVTQGQGDIRLFSQDSVLLGLSRVMTAFGGDILAWSEQGDINAGRGSRTTLLYTPPRRLYDNWGNVLLSPQAPATGAGFATLDPIPEVPPGDVDLIAPLGTIDAGEAGIRVSGNINLAALQVLNAANIQVQGESKGLPVLATVNVNALASASAAANSASQAAQDVMRKSQDDARRNQPSVISVQILGFGSGTSSIAPPARGTTANSGYDANSAFQFPQASRDEGTQRR
ncbi:transporter [Stenotrophomonas maltophilia]|uniref:filamentous haemagglutinin family protein n=1 Tax=Stenotrophomonas maltophilia TaxID=40324 RepID=UPI0008106E9A|nr:filamentous haemagglutinin family protein [Stenotrophomonas maltophilia]OCK47879.1 transporter [Stenotrophomonas maltophilia]